MVLALLVQPTMRIWSSWSWNTTACSVPRPLNPRLRLFIFPLDDAVRGRDWFAEGLVFGGGSNPDYLFGFDKGFPPESMAGNGGGVVGSGSKDVSDWGSEERSLAGDFPPDFDRHNALLVNRKLANSRPNPNPDPSNRVCIGSYSYYGQKLPESVISAAPATVAVPLPVQVPVETVQERHVTSGAHAPSLVGGETPVQPVYYIPAQAGLRPVTGQVGHPYYTLPGGAPGQVFTATGMAAPPPVHVAQPKVVVAEPDGVAVGFDASGRRVYYTAAGGVAPVYKVMAVSGGALSAENKVLAASVNHQN